MSKPLKGKVAVVTGASRGLGRAIVAHLAELGADTVLIARDQNLLDEVAAAMKTESGRVLTISCDVSDVEQVKQATAKIVSDMGRVDILVNNVGIPAPRTFEETSISDWDTVIGVNLNAAFYMTHSLWGALIDSGAGYVVNIAGTAGLRGGGSPAYGATKFGLSGLNFAIAAAGKDHNLRSTILYPGGMDTGWRGAPIGVKPASETMSPDEVARFIGNLVTSPTEFVVNEAVLNPIAQPFM
ncbi:MAG: SDR family oxidoreductase [Anaerolineaceae bacterium]|nr:MAG: SDR family oxidoreductase [Anaerolineaceae bacterium]